MGHDSRVKPVEEAVFPDIINPKDGLAELLCRLHGSKLLSIDRTDLGGVLAVQIFDSFRSVLYLYSSLASEHPPATLNELMFAGYYVWNMEEMHSDSQTHSPLHSQSTMGMPAVPQCRCLQSMIRFMQMN